MRWTALILVLLLVPVTGATAASQQPCQPKFSVGLNIEGGAPAGAPKAWPIYIDGNQVGITNSKGMLQVTPTPGDHKFSTASSWSYKGKTVNYSGEIKKTVTCNMWSLNIPVRRK